MIIQELLNQGADNETIANAMLQNWKDHQNLFDEYKDEIYEILDVYNFEPCFIFDNVLIDYDTYKQYEKRKVIIKINDEFFAIYYSCTAYGGYEFGQCEKVYPVKKVTYDVEYRLHPEPPIHEESKAYQLLKERLNDN